MYKTIKNILIVKTVLNELFIIKLKANIKDKIIHLNIQFKYRVKTKKKFKK